MDSTQAIPESLKWVFTFKDFVPAIAAFLGVLVGASVGIYGARLQFRSQVNARYRQDLIAVLRDTVAEFQSLAATLNIMKWAGLSEGQTQADSRAKIERLALLSNKIGIVIDRKDRDEANLFVMTVAVVQDLRKSKTETTAETHGELMNQLVEITQRVVQKHWELMKEGK